MTPPSELCRHGRDRVRLFGDPEVLLAVLVAVPKLLLPLVVVPLKKKEEAKKNQRCDGR